MSLHLAGRQVSRIGYGAMQLEPSRISESDAIGLLRRALDLGVDHLDTAWFYGAGAVNDRIRHALVAYEAVVVSTKVGATDRAGSLAAAQHPHDLRAQVEENLASLGVETLDVVNLRRMDRPPGIVAGPDQLVDIDDQLDELVRLREEGKLRSIGLSNIEPDQLQAALPAGIACVQNVHNVLDRSTDPVLAMCASHQIAFVPYFPLGSAFDAVESVPDHDVVRAVARRLGCTPAQVGLAWELTNSPVTLLIPGTRSVAHLEENVAAADVELDDEAMRVLGDLGAPAERPSH